MLSYVVTILTPDKLIVAEVLFSLIVLTAYFKSSRAKPRVWPRSPPLLLAWFFFCFNHVFLATYKGLRGFPRGLLV